MVLDSFIPFLKDHSSINLLPIFRGMALQFSSSTGGETSGSNLMVVTKEKYFFGLEY